MSLGIAFKGPEGVVLAADSRVTLFAERRNEDTGRFDVFPSSFDNATKVLEFDGHSHIAAVTYGLGALGAKSPRTAHSFTPELEAEFSENLRRNPDADSQSVEEYARQLGAFFMRQWAEQGMPPPNEYSGEPMIFQVGGFNDGEPYGRVYDVIVPFRPDPMEQNPDSFGVTWGGQGEAVARLIVGFDDRLVAAVSKILGLAEDANSDLFRRLKSELHPPIPYQFLSLQDSVDFCCMLIRTTMQFQRFQVGVRGVGGAIDVAVITRTSGLRHIRRKVVAVGEGGE